jgi:pantoate--beta-alanine ligase
MKLITDPGDFSGNDNRQIALVPTMGALHEGHLSLVRLAKEKADAVIVSIFVNPTQFGAGEDFDKYPRNLEEDMSKLEQVGVDAVFSPSVEIMYPGQTAVSICPGNTANILEGAIRPGHFAGVTQIVSKLFNLVRPDVAVFGEKDAQQLAIIKQMVRDLNYPIRIIEAPIVREPDGLAMSSRNAYLSFDQRALAVNLSAALKIGAMSPTPASQIKATRSALQTANIEPEYVEVVTWPAFEIVSGEDRTIDGQTRLLLAAKIGTTRLIDNVMIGE